MEYSSVNPFPKPPETKEEAKLLMLEEIARIDFSQDENDEQKKKALTRAALSSEAQSAFIYVQASTYEDRCFAARALAVQFEGIDSIDHYTS